MQVTINPHSWTKIAKGSCEVGCNYPYEFILFADGDKRILNKGYCNPYQTIKHKGDIYAKSHDIEVMLTVVFLVKPSNAINPTTLTTSDLISDDSQNELRLGTDDKLLVLPQKVQSTNLLAKFILARGNI